MDTLTLNNFFRTFTAYLLICLFITSCTAHEIEPAPDTSGSPTTVPQFVETNPPTQNTSPSLTETLASDGPFLLLQTDFDVYQIIDFDLETITPVDLPDSNEQYRLAGNLSPSGTQILLLVNNEEVQVMDLSTGGIRKTYALLDHNVCQFQSDQAASTAWEASPESANSADDMLSAVQSAYSESILNIQWYQDDDHILLISTGSETSTNLFLDDLHTGERVQLEDLPGLVQDAWISPNGNDILLKKGYNFEPGIWQDDQYYLVDIEQRKAERIPLPVDVRNPSLFWQSSQSIGIIHQTVLTGGVNVSIIDAASLETTQIIDGAFTFLYSYSDSFLILRQDQEEKTSDLSIIDFNGQELHSHTLDQLCSLKTVFNERIILNCETQSLLLDSDLQEHLFGDPVFLLNPSPDGQTSVLVTRTDSVSLLDDSLEMSRSLTLNGIPLEIRWLPDSSGFIYRTRGELHHYDLSSEKDRILLASDLFSDYTNLNAVWVTWN